MSIKPEVDLDFCDSCELRGILIDGQYCARTAIDNAKWLFSTIYSGELPTADEELVAEIAQVEPVPNAKVVQFDPVSETCRAVTVDEALAGMVGSMLPDLASCISHVKEYGKRPDGPVFLD